MFGLYALGAVVFTSCWPERSMPAGSFTDYIGASHMLWHLFVTAAALTFWSNCEVMRDAYRNGPVSMNACGDDNAKEE